MITTTITTPVNVQHVEPGTDRLTDAVTLWRLRVFVGLFRLSRELYIVAPTQYHAACIADQLLTDDEWFPTFSAEPVASGGGSR